MQHELRLSFPAGDTGPEPSPLLPGNTDKELFHFYSLLFSLHWLLHYNKDPRNKCWKGPLEGFVLFLLYTARVAASKDNFVPETEIYKHMRDTKGQQKFEDNGYKEFFVL